MARQIRSGLLHCLTGGSRCPSRRWAPAFAGTTLIAASLFGMLRPGRAWLLVSLPLADFPPAILTLLIIGGAWCMSPRMRG